MNEAIEKLTNEIGDGTNPYIKVIGEFLIQQLQEDHSLAEAILAEGKTIEGSLSAMRDAAKTKAVNGMAMLTDAEGFAIVLNYYGIKKEAVAFTPVSNDITVAQSVAKPKAKKPRVKKAPVPTDDFVQTTLDDFLGGADDEIA